jgi:hypothetical protein
VNSGPVSTAGWWVTQPKVSTDCGDLQRAKMMKIVW